ncbi:MAG: heparinase II/III-family protein, partial [Rhodovibrionaceae bacterium]|nr:heparinase II/III-family protein [Rhodovibrionaceae bacterium]
GPDYLPGHAHADTLSFELSLFGHRIFVNSGTSVYGAGTERLRQRGTAAHNTVVVSGHDSSEVWGGFRVARRAGPSEVRIAEKRDCLVAEGAHDGYRRLPGRPMHRRRWSLSAGRLQIADEVAPAAPAEARFHLHPDVAIERGEGSHGTLHLASGEIVGWRARAAEIRIEETTWHPEFGRSIPNKCLVLSLSDGRATLDLNWE